MAEVLPVHQVSICRRCGASEHYLLTTEDAPKPHLCGMYDYSPMAYDDDE